MSFQPNINKESNIDKLIRSHAAGPQAKSETRVQYLTRAITNISKQQTKLLSKVADLTKEFDDEWSKLRTFNEERFALSIFGRLGLTKKGREIKHKISETYNRIDKLGDSLNNLQKAIPKLKDSQHKLEDAVYGIERPNDSSLTAQHASWLDRTVQQQERQLVNLRVQVAGLDDDFLAKNEEKINLLNTNEYVNAGEYLRKLEKNFTNMVDTDPLEVLDAMEAIDTKLKDLHQMCIQNKGLANSKVAHIPDDFKAALQRKDVLVKLYQGAIEKLIPFVKGQILAEESQPENISKNARLQSLSQLAEKLAKRYDDSKAWL